MGRDGGRGWVWLTALALVCTTVLHGVSAFDVHTLETEWSSLEKMEKVLQTAMFLPLHSQKTILRGIGDAMVGLGEGQCNIFGGQSSCVPIPSDSDYGKLCPLANKNVDCGFQMEALEHIAKDPETHFREKLSAEGYPECKQCYSTLQHLWCAQTVPTCGTFDRVIDEILPLVTMVALKKEKPSVALQQAVPRMLQAASLGLPCRKMCEAITETCGCGQPTTFGEVMTALQTGKHREAYNTNMSLSTAKDIFQMVWDKPVCDLFAESNMPGFVGVCTLPESSISCSWCKGKSARPKVVHEQVVAQMAQTLSGLMQGGLEKVLTSAAGDKAKKAVAAWNWNQNEAANKKRRSGHSGVVVVLVILVFVASGAFLAAVRLHRSGHHPSQYVDLNSMGYTPPIL